MLDLGHVPTTKNVDYFYNTGGTSSWITWEKPTRGITMLEIICIGAGGGGRSGWIIDSISSGGNTRGGGGGASGGFSRLLIAADNLPDVLYISVGKGGKGGAATLTANTATAGSSGTTSYVSIAPATDPIYVVCYANGGSGAALGSALSSPGGTAASVAVQTSALISNLGQFFALAGQAGADYGTDITYPTTGILLSGGAPGGGTNSSSAYSGYSVYAPTQSLFSLILTRTGGQTAGTVGESGISISQPLMSIGGAGGAGALNGTTAYNGEGGSGGNGGLGSGGGGGGGGTPSLESSSTILLGMPLDGSSTGTYGSLQYSSSSYTQTTTTYGSRSYTSSSLPRGSAGASWRIADATAWSGSNNGYQQTISSENINIVSSNPYAAFTNTASNTGWANHVYNDSSGNIYVTTETGLLFKFNSSWTLQWQRKMIWREGSNNTYRTAGVKINVDSSGNIYWLLNFMAGSENLRNLLVKYDSSGTLLSVKILGTDAWYFGISFGFDMTTDSSGNIYILVTDTGEYLNVVKLSSSLVISWQYIYGNYPNITPAINYGPFSQHDGNTWGGTPIKGQGGIQVDGSGNIYIATVGKISDTSEANAQLIKLDSSANLQWMTDIGNTGPNNFQVFRDLALDSSGNIYATGYHQSSGSTFGSFTVKFDSSGTVLWQRSIDRTVDSFYPNSLSISLDSSNNVYICGGAGSTARLGHIVKYDSSGNVSWQRTISTGSSSTNTVLNSIAVNSTSGKYYAVGFAGYLPTSRSNGSGGNGGDGLVIIRSW